MIWGCKEKYVPCGIVDEDSAELTITFGSSYKTSDFIVDALAAKWDALEAHEKAATSLLHIKMDNGPESSGRRTQFLHRMVQFADDMNKPIHLCIIRRITANIIQSSGAGVSWS